MQASSRLPTSSNTGALPTLGLGPRRSISPTLAKRLAFFLIANLRSRPTYQLHCENRLRSRWSARYRTLSSLHSFTDGGPGPVPPAAVGLPVTDMNPLDRPPAFGSPADYLASRAVRHRQATSLRQPTGPLRASSGRLSIVSHVIA